LGIFVLGGLQAFFGWYMVHSGLVHEPRVSHYRLALHLSTAFASISWIWWLALSIRGKVVAYRPPELKPWLYGSAVLLVLQIILGAFTAGKDAGHASDQWPMWVDGQFTPSTNDFELNWLWNNESWIQFVHRSFAYLVVLSFITTAWKAHGLRWRHPAIGAMPWIILLQFLLGVLTVMSGVNLSLALLHQLLALLLLLAVVYALHPGKRGIK
jgi:cytochrome c oxidase assembly protein subunit 15